MKRIIFLVDMNAFYISCEMSRNHNLKGIPAAVAGDPEKRSGIVLAANYEARSYKVKTTMTLNMARNLCPNIIFVPPDSKFYNSRSKDVMDILSRYSPVIQQNSIDEAWLDMTGCENLFGKPFEIAKKIMKDIVNELDLSCSIGISNCKFLAKMASEMKKPLGITELWQDDIGRKLWPLKLREMYGIGSKTEEKLNSMGMYYIGDIAKSEKRLLIKKLGKYGDELHRLANGIDFSPVIENPIYDSKSIGRSITLSKDIVDIEEAKFIIMELSEEVGTEARKCEYKGKTISIVIKYSDFRSVTRQKAVSPTYLSKDIYLSGFDLLEKNWDDSRPVRLLGITLSNFDDGQINQISIFDIYKNVENDTVKTCKYNEKEEKLEKTIDFIREKYGMDKIKRANLINRNNN